MVHRNDINDVGKMEQSGLRSFKLHLHMKGEIMFNNAHTIVISHYCISTQTLPPIIHRGFRLLRFCRGCGFRPTMFGKDEVLPRANGPIVLSGTVLVCMLLSIQKAIQLQLTFLPSLAISNISLPSPAPGTRIDMSFLELKQIQIKNRLNMQ